MSTLRLNREMSRWRKNPYGAAANARMISQLNRLLKTERGMRLEVMARPDGQVIVWAMGVPTEPV